MNKEEDKALIPQEESVLGRIVITQAQVELIKNTVAQNATDDELKLLFFECRRRGVHPLDRLIHFVKRGEGAKARVTFQCGIDFMRSQAEATGEYRGQDDIEYGSDISIEGHPEKTAPEWAKSIIKRRDPITNEIITTSATAYWVEFYPGETLGFMWRKMPRLMLGKCAEAQGLRKAFPRPLQGLYTFEEMEQANIIETPSKQPILPPQALKTTGVTDVTKLSATEYLAGQESPESEKPNELTVKVTNVMQKVGGTKDKPWTRYTVFIGSMTYSTFDKKLSDIAKKAKELDMPVQIEYEEKGKYGKELTDIQLVTVLAEVTPECEQNPDLCGESKYDEQGKAYCGDSTDKPCPYHGQGALNI